MTQKKHKKKVSNAIKSRLLFIVGLLLCTGTLISDIISTHYQDQLITTYMSEIEDTNIDFSEALEKAYDYNEVLYQMENASVSNSWELLTDANYNNTLNITGNGMMGSIEIPSISVNLPIYHGTSDEVLTIGVGHAQGSSLPVGGENTRSILTGHRGLPNAKLFTRLDELKEGDLFYIYICDQILAYRVYLIEVIEPDDVEKIKIVSDKDLVSLVTCTPYGINTHRLIVTGQRVEYIPEVHEEIVANIPSAREILFTVTPLILCGFAVITLFKKKKGAQEINETK